MPIMAVMKAMGMESDQEVVQMVGRDPRYSAVLLPSIEVAIWSSNFIYQKKIYIWSRNLNSAMNSFVGKVKYCWRNLTEAFKKKCVNFLTIWSWQCELLSWSILLEWFFVVVVVAFISTVCGYCSCVLFTALEEPWRFAVCSFSSTPNQTLSSIPFKILNP